MNLKTIFKAIGNFFKGIFTSDEAKEQEQAIVKFVGTDVGALALDAVEYVQTALPGASSVEKRDAAVAKLKEDAAKAGKDLSELATSTLNWFIETALQYAVAKGLALVLAAEGVDPGEDDSDPEDGRLTPA